MKYGALMNSSFVNPIVLSFQLLESYRGLLDQTLAVDRLSADDRAVILENIEVERGLYFSLNRKYQRGATRFRQFCQEHGLAHRLPDMLSTIDGLYVHQEQAINAISRGDNTIISTGTGSGKTESFLIPILDHCLKNPARGIQALIIYPMNALASDQLNRLARYTAETAESAHPITFGSYTGATPQHHKNDDDVKRLGSQHRVYRDEIMGDPPNILITNYVMLDWMLTNPDTAQLFTASADCLHFIVIDELHSYRGNKATHLKYLLRRLKQLLSTCPIQIGTSATLADQHSGGYLGSSGSDTRLANFVKPLLEIEDYKFITAEYEPELSVDTCGPIRTALPSGWALTLDNEAGRTLLQALTGHAIRESVLTDPEHFVQSDTYRAFAADIFIVKLRELLIDKGAQSFSDLVRLFIQLLPETSAVSDPENLVKTYLSAIAFVNHHAGTTPVLDFRLHLFLREIGGSLKRCIRCYKYHSGGQEACTECGYPLFYVSRENIQSCIGKVSGNRLKWELRAESDDRKNAYYVRIMFAELHSAVATVDTLSFSLTDDPSSAREELPLRFDPAGRLRLSVLPMQRYDDVEDDLIRLVDGSKGYQYLHQLVKTLLDAYVGDKSSRKCLGFTDNREAASRLSAVLNDEFASDFFENFMRLYYPPDADWSLLDTLPRMRHNIKELRESDRRSPLECELFDEFEVWFRRWLGVPARYAQSAQALIKLKHPDKFSAVEQALLKIFIDERAIAHTLDRDMPDSRFIRFEKHWATDQRAIRLDGREVIEPHHSTVVLADPAAQGQGKAAQNTVYYNFVKIYGIDAIRIAVSQLVKDGVLVEDQALNEQNERMRPGYYYVSPEHICIDSETLDRHVGANRASNYDDLRNRLLLVAGLHSSEVDVAQRTRAEADFQAGNLQFLLATPTLEMGIDIGKLQNVLLIGVPPLPSNYAQRAGRAGRGSGQNYALIVTLCSEENHHDVYYFANPKQMINGAISPPTFNPTNERVVIRHMNAFALAPFLKNGRSLSDFWDDYERNMADRVTEAERVFDDYPAVQHYFEQRFKKAFAAVYGKIRTRKGSPRQYLYGNGFFPDYSFRRDGVNLIKEADWQKLESAAEKNVDEPDDGSPTPLDVADYALSTRDPEMAFYKFVPGNTAYVGGEVYTILPSGDFKENANNESPCEVSTRSYHTLAVSKQVRFATKSKVTNQYKLTVTYDGDEQAIRRYNVLQVAYIEHCHIHLYNCGIRRSGGVEAFDKDQHPHAIQYDLTPRKALVLKFAADICHDERYTLSLASCLDRAIKDNYGLDESEVRLISPDQTAESALYVILYDANGNGNVPLDQVFQRFDELVAGAYEKMRSCDCANGCYLCMRSYGTHYYAGRIRKELALMFTGYLLGHNPFKPSLPTLVPYILTPDLTLSLKMRGSVPLVTCNAHLYTENNGAPQNTAIFRTMIRAIRAEFVEGMHSIRIESGLQYVLSGISAGAIKEDTYAFSELQFELLRFSNVMVQKI